MGNHRHLSTSFVVNGEVRLPHCVASRAADNPSDRSIDRQTFAVYPLSFVLLSKIKDNPLR